MPILFHIADAHLGAPFEALPPEAGAACRTAQMDALRDAVDHANDLAAAAILIPGDLFDAPDAPLPVFSEAMDALSRAHCPVLVSPGNHDHLHPASPYRKGTLPANVHVFDGTALEPFALDADTVVWGAAFCDLAARIPLDAPLDPQKCNILCVHADLESVGAYNPVRPADLAASGFDYAAFGHNHTYSGLRRAGDTLYACPGCLTAHGAAETGPRGYLFGTVAKGACDLRFKQSCGVPFLTLTQDMTGIPDDRALGRAIAAAIPAGHERACLTLELIGERSYEPDLAGLRRALSQVCVHAALRDHTTVTLDPWRYEQGDDLRGAVTRRFRERYDAETGAEGRAQRLLALRFALAALDGVDPT